MSINWTLVFWTTLATVNLLIALADFLQGGLVWPCLLLVIGVQVMAALGVWR